MCLLRLLLLLLHILLFLLLLLLFLHMLLPSLHCVALVWPAGSTSTTCGSTKRHTSNPKSESLAQICRKTLSNISWQRGRVTQGITLLAGSEWRGERGEQHELQKILQRHDSTLANVADAANTASVASPLYIAIFMSCWPENGDWY